jgi:hypothetical protein
MKIILFAALFSASAVWSTTAATIFTNRSAYEAALAGASSYVIKAPPVSAGDYWEEDTAAGDVTYRIQHPVPTGADSYMELNTGFDGGLVSVTAYDFLHLTFAGSHSAIEFKLSKWVSTGSPWDIKINGEAVGTVAVDTYRVSSFVGIINDTPITSLLIENKALGSKEVNLVGERLAAVPEPSSLGLLAFGAAGLVARRQRRKIS